MSSKYTYLIWDFNGTLLDDSRLASDINCRMNLKRGKPEISYEFYREHFTHPPIDYYYKMGYTFEEESYDQVSREFITEYSRYQHLATLSQGVLPVLEQVKQAGLQQLIISAHKQNLLQEHVKELGISPYFSHVIGSDSSVIIGKVERALKFAKEEDMDLSKAVFFGDTIHDLETARALGCDCLLYSGGHQARVCLEGYGVEVFDSIKEMGDWVLAK